MDLQTLSALEDYLTEVFTGCLVVVSHDSVFVNKVAEHLFVFEGDGIVRDFLGSFTDYTEYRQDKQAEDKRQDKANTKASVASASAAAASSSAAPVLTETAGGKSAKTPPPPSLNFNERKEFGKLEAAIAKLGAQKSELQVKLESCKDGYSVLAEITEQIDKLQGQIDEKEARWFDLSSRE